MKEYPFQKSGLMGFGNPVVWDAAANEQPSPSGQPERTLYFTEGWRRYGRKTTVVSRSVSVTAIASKRTVDVIYRDEFQVAVRPRRKPQDN
jgi:hypothetical protein